MNRNSDISTKSSYWVVRLKISTFIKILLKNKKEAVQRLTFIESGKPTLFVVRLLEKWGVITFSLQKIKPRAGVAGPVLHLSKVRNDRGAVITLDVYRHILEIRRRISCSLMSSFEEVLACLGEKSIALIHAWIGLQIAEEITPSIYLAHYSRWKYENSDSYVNYKNILVIPQSNWGPFLRRNLEESGLVDKVVVERHLSRKVKRLGRLAWSLVQSAVLSFSRDTRNNSPSSEDHAGKGKKVLVNYSLGIDRELRNDLSIFYSADFDLSRVLVYVKYPGASPSDSELKWFANNKIDCWADPGFSDTLRGAHDWHPTIISKIERVRFYRRYLKIFVRVIISAKEHSSWILAKSWEMGNAMASLKDFFITNNVGVVVHSVASANSFIANLALSEVGGIAVDTERSILFDYCTTIHNSPCHVRFVTGTYSAGQIPEPTFSQYTLQSGALSRSMESSRVEEIGRHKKDGRIVLALFDEIPNDVFHGDSVETFYRSALDLVSKDDRFFLVVKTKKPKVLGKWPELTREIEQLRQEGKCLFLHWKTTVPTVSSHSDLVMSLPSTAAFESVLTGVPTVVFNPMRTGSSLFYRNNGLNRRIFEDSETMVTAIKSFAGGGNEKVGDCSDIVKEIDPLGDGLGSERVGQYLKWCLEGFDLGMNRDEILERANKSYALKWGITKSILKSFHGPG